MLKRGLPIIQGAYGAEHVYLAYALVGLGGVLHVQGKDDEALPLLERGLKIREQDGTQPRERAEALFAVAKVLWRDAETRERALSMAQDARAVLLEAGPDMIVDREEIVPGWRAGRTRSAALRLDRHPAHAAAGEGVGLAHRLAGHRVEREPGPLNRFGRASCQVTASGDLLPQRFESSLPLEAMWLVVGDVLQEHETPAADQDPLDLREGSIEIGDGAQHEAAHDGVECRVGERELLGARIAHLGDAAETRRQSSRQACAHVLVGLGQHELRQALWVVWE